MLGDEVDGVDEVAALGLADEVGEGEPEEAELEGRGAARDLPLDRGGGLGVDAGQAVDVRRRAEAAAARLDAEEVVEERDDEVRVEHRARAPRQRVADCQRDDRDALEPGVAEHEEARVGRPGVERRTDEPVLELGDRLRADLLPEREGEPGPDRLDDRGRAAPPRGGPGR